MRDTRVMSRFKAREDILAREQNPLKNLHLLPKGIARFESIRTYLRAWIDRVDRLVGRVHSPSEFTFACAASLELACCSFYVI